MTVAALGAKDLQHFVRYLKRKALLGRGKLFLNTNGCLAEINVLNPSVQQIEKLESDCKTPAA